MELVFNRENVTIKGREGTRTFYLEEHTNEEFDSYMEQVSVVFDRAIVRLREISKQHEKGLTVDADELGKLKAEVAQHSATVVASILKPVEPATPVDAEWVRKHLTWKMREQLMNKQNELDGMETVKDQGFLVETTLAKNQLAIKMELNRIKLNIQDIKSNLTPESESSQESATETVQLPEHVSVDDLEIDDDGYVQQ